ncbi:MAG TPA: hypothetical protein VF167_03855 [Longimicrobiaceae bacterium]
MATLILPPHPRTALLRGFGVALGLIVLLIVSLLALAVGSLPGVLSGIALGLIVAVIGVVSPRLSFRLYRTWNRAAAAYARFAQSAVLLISFHILMRGARHADRSLHLSRTPNGESAWVRRETVPPGAYPSLDASPSQSEEDSSWISSLVRWAARPGHRWSYWLLPHLLVLRILETEAADDYPGGIYTLY